VSSVDWREIRYGETFDQEVQGLLRRRKADPDCRVEDLEGVLRHLYHMDGSDWGGRGELQAIVLSATIAAYEHVVAQWKAENNGP
jgi:hypothetical protein